ncbi:MAG: HlyD family efflux transporter periplasmic adaptor subunit [Phycisphaerales bacterium]
MVRKIIVVVVSVAILAGGIFIKKTLEDSKKPPVKKKDKLVTSIFTETVVNGTVPILAEATGRIEAKNRVELYAEVQGVMTSSAGSFKAGERYSKGSLLASIDSDVYRAGVMAQKSTLQNLITAALADIRLDFPDSFERWSTFLSKLDVKKPMPELPEPASDKEKMFITGRNIYTTYYNIRNMELTLAKYTLSAPFDGILTEALVTPGTLIRPGQKLGTFIQPTVFEMEAPVSSAMVKFLKVGQTVDVYSTQHRSQTWKGTVSRINSLVNTETQTVNVYIQLTGSGMDEGMYATATVAATEVTDAIEIDRSVLFDKDQVYVAKDSLLVQKTIEPVYFNEKTVVIKGLENGEQVLAKMPPGAYPGMKVAIYKGE